MAATRIQRMAYTAVGAAVIIIISAVYQYTPNTVEKRIIEYQDKPPERMNITVVNENPVGSGQWIELRCNAYLDKETNLVWWASKVFVFQAGKKGVIWLPKMRESDVVDVFCTYRGWNGCRAEKIKMFEIPGNDAYYCSESVRECTVTFEPDGGVIKRHGERKVSFLGFVPSSGKQECTSWFGCLIDSGSRIIGKRTCCGAQCASW